MSAHEVLSRTIGLEPVRAHLLSVRVILLITTVACVSLSVAQTSIRPENAPALDPPGEQPGTLEGFVTLGGTVIPSVLTVENATDPNICGRTHTLDDLLVSPRNRGIANVIVALAGVSKPWTRVAGPKRLVLDNRDCRFSPHVAVAETGVELVARNCDPVLHTTHLYGTLEANLALPFEDMSVTQIIDKPGMIIVKCDVHGWMQAYVRVDDHPFHAVTDASGSFRITDIPPGRYELQIWQERLGALTRTVLIESGKTQEIRIEYPALAE